MMTRWAVQRALRLALKEVRQVIDTPDMPAVERTTELKHVEARLQTCLAGLADHG